MLGQDLLFQLSKIVEVWKILIGMGVFDFRYCHSW